MVYKKRLIDHHTWDNASHGFFYAIFIEGYTIFTTKNGGSITRTAERT